MLAVAEQSLPGAKLIRWQIMVYLKLFLPCPDQIVARQLVEEQADFHLRRWFNFVHSERGVNKSTFL